VAGQSGTGSTAIADEGGHHVSERDPRRPSDTVPETARRSSGGPAHRYSAQPDELTRRPAGSGGQSVVTIGQFFATLRRHLLLVLTCLLLGLALSYGLAAKTAKTYQATAVVDITPTLPTSSGSNDVNTITEAKIATSSSVAIAAARKLGFAGLPDELAQHVSVTSPLSSQVLNITFSSSTAQGAADGANAFAQSYLDYRTATAQADLQLRISRINDQISTLQKSKNPGVNGQVAQLLSQLNTYRTTVVTPGNQATQASPPSGPSSPKVPLYLAGGLLFGLLIGAVLAVVRDLRDDRVWGKADLERSLGAPVIAEAASAEVTARTWPRSLATVTDPRGAEADAYRSLTTTVSAEDGDSRIVMLCSTGREGHSLAPMNLAVSYAQQGLRTVLAGPRRALEPATGLLGASQLAGGLDQPAGPLAEQLIESATVDNLALLNLGDEVRLGATLRGTGDRLAEVLGRAEVIVLDGVNIELASTSLRLGQLADEVVVLVYANRTTHQALQVLAQHLAQVRAHISGAILLARQPRLHRLARSRAVAAPARQPGSRGSTEARSPIPLRTGQPDHRRREQPAAREDGAEQLRRPITGAAKGR
jgi:capsular polysaccharide biosynthesis protein/Mrp family chromosome partitioning ATPase